MIQPATLRLESSGGQQNATYFNRDVVLCVMMLQLHMLKWVILEVHNQH
jgi:hypothetical protein